MTTENTDDAKNITTSHADPVAAAITPSLTTRAGVDRVVLDRVRAEHGPDAITTRKPAGMSLDYPAPADPVHGIAAAVAVANYARGQAHRFARHARAAGVPWRDLAGPLGLDLTDPDVAMDPGHYAFREVVGDLGRRFDLLTVGWDCDSCGKWVTDTGPYNGHPADDETGHADDCERHTREIREWHARTGWDD